MKPASIFGWIAMITGVGFILSPMLSVMTGFAVASISSTAYQIQINFSLVNFAVGGVLFLVGIVMTKFDNKSILEKE